MIVDMHVVWHAIEGMFLGINEHAVTGDRCGVIQHVSNESDGGSGLAQ